MDRYKSAWQGAAEGINSGIDNAIKLYSAKNAQEDQAYKQTLRQREEAEYAEKMKPLGTVGEVVSRYSEGPESRKAMLGTIQTFLGKGENDPILKHEGEKIISAMGVDQKKALFDATGKDVATKIKTMTDALNSMEQTTPAALAMQQEIAILKQKHLGYTAESRRYQREIDEEARKQAKEDREKAIAPLEQQKIKAETKKLNAYAEYLRNKKGIGEDGLTPAQKRQEEERQKKYTLQDIDATIRAYDKIAAEAKKNGTPVPPQIIKGTAMAWNARKKIVAGQLNPRDVVYHDINNLPDTSKSATNIQPPKAEGVKLDTPERPKENNAVSGKYKTKADALSAIKELSAADALNVMRANGITKDELREFLNPTKKQQTPRPVTGMPLSFS